jgi:acyl carrier protein
MAMQSDVRALIVRVVAIELNRAESVVVNATSLRNDLAMDSVAAANVLFALEEECGVELDVNRVDSLDTLQDIEDLIAASTAVADD